MTVVVDASALIDALLIDGPARARLSSASLHAPELIDAEVLSVLRRLVLAGSLAEADGLRALDAASRLGLRRHPIRDLCKRAWQLRANLSAYDALYAALAERIAAPLLTADARLARAPGMGCSVVLVEA
ncbi:MAG: PIN domain-containing protein [Cyanobacteria bacterium M_surface_7_m2_040]|nr:PIN domain-containing protein [Cyanobacteria bacterium M_surface_7_m2_040]